MIQSRCSTQLAVLQRLARSSTIGEYSHLLSDVSKWSRSVSSMDEAQLEQMRAHARAHHGNSESKQKAVRAGHRSV